MILGAIEAGGTKFVCAVGDEHGRIHKREVFPTTVPEETMANVIEFFRPHGIEAIGVGSFGPIDLRPSSPTYGYITSTPKQAWTNFDFVGTLKQYFPVPIGFDTDVNAAALGELRWGAAQGLDSCLYMTVGTGIGVGAVVEGRLLHGLLHPEMGHIVVRRHPDDAFAGICPYHGDCLEGMASGPAIERRWGKKGAELAARNEVWELEAFYLAQAIADYIFILSPEKVIVGGGVMKQTHVLPLVHRYVQEWLGGYIQHEAVLTNIEAYIVLPGLGDNAGISGALALAAAALE
ncbi:MULTISPECIES: ROK family protein [Geobacillus]|uniref:fructokinase n=1 Tax=Geobacillus thermodenitrificans (strain NG80-2) TaxID=420246 RepID=A4IT14_GEOTN|nr:MULTISPECIES: ROK family protein [Geobacillus]ABO68468.1 Fructokinase [Geobacillus thermodenitrificans NG80-2]KQB91718.1 putative fructokinase [Geobacillus sp. PA-3]MED0663194.1 fructokinase [Geobacillus thermodenitrificans]NNU87890.1 ROK family protein [Geobacillus sp. MR]OQP08793.1 fructokinase [Geobacillus sp. 47C-IIb]